MSRPDIDTAVADARAIFQRLRSGASAPPAVSPAKAEPPPAAPAQVAAPSLAGSVHESRAQEIAADRDARRAELRRQRPPSHYLANNDDAAWRDHVGADGTVAFGAGRGDWWGPI